MCIFHAIYLEGSMGISLWLLFSFYNVFPQKLYIWKQRLSFSLSHIVIVRTKLTNIAKSIWSSSVFSLGSSTNIFFGICPHIIVPSFPWSVTVFMREEVLSLVVFSFLTQVPFQKCVERFRCWHSFFDSTTSEKLKNSHYRF